MTDRAITSRHNSLISHARAVRDGRVEDQIFIEGLRLAEEAACARLSIQDVLHTQKFSMDERGSRLLDNLKELGCRLSLVSEDVLASASATKTPQGILMLAARPRSIRQALLTGTHVEEHRSESSTRPALLVIMHRVNNPANAGAIVRTAEAAGATGAIATVGTADLFSPKALRGAMGSSFRLPLWTGARFEEALSWCEANGLQRIGAALHATRVHTEVDWKNPSALVVGPEASGLDENETSSLDETIRIPMRETVESLNVAVASAVVLYEALRQRGNLL